jgi:hypothetical protein
MDAGEFPEEPAKPAQERLLRIRCAVTEEPLEYRGFCEIASSLPIASLQVKAVPTAAGDFEQEPTQQQAFQVCPGFWKAFSQSFQTDARVIGIQEQRATLRRAQAGDDHIEPRLADREAERRWGTAFARVHSPNFRFPRLPKAGSRAPYKRMDFLSDPFYGW